jgi:acetylornithine deacetylase/succinyl-diaminopimelate desuccinylase-like protein
VTGGTSTDPGAGALGGVRVRVDFKVSDEQAAQAVAAKMVDRAHEIANQPDCECDVDVSVEWLPPDDTPAQVEQLAESARGRPTDL